MRFLAVIFAFVTCGFVNSRILDHRREEHGVCRQPADIKLCYRSNECNSSLCHEGCFPLCFYGICKCHGQPDRESCKKYSDCSKVCPDGETSYCHSGLCHCHEAVECDSSKDCTCPDKNQTPECEADPDNTSQKHCHCIENNAKECSSAADCTTACHDGKTFYCHSGSCHCHETDECKTSDDCTCPDENQTPECEADPDNTSHKHCHCN